MLAVVACGGWKGGRGWFVVDGSSDTSKHVIAIVATSFLTSTRLHHTNIPAYYYEQ